MDPSSSTSSTLTADQLLRIKLNKKRARDILQTKRKRPLQQQHQTTKSTSLAFKPPEEKRPVIKAPLVHTERVDLPDATLSYSSNTSTPQFSSATPQFSSATAQFTLATPQFSSATLQFSSATHLVNAPSVGSNRTALQCPTTSSHPSAYSCTRDSSQSFSSARAAAPLPSNTSNKTTSLMPQPPSRSIASAASSASYVQLKERVMAKFVMLSKSRFKVEVPYDAEVIEIFKKMKTRSYGE